MPYEYDPRVRTVIDHIYEKIRTQFEYQASDYKSWLGLIKNPYNRFLTITQHREGAGEKAHLAFRIYDGHESIFSKERSGERFVITAIPSTVGDNLENVQYQITPEKRYYLKNDEGFETKYKHIGKAKNLSAEEVLKFFLLRLRDHERAADTARNIFAAGLGVGVLSVAFLISGGGKHEPRKPVKQEITEERKNQLAPLIAPVSPAPAPHPFGEQETFEKQPESETDGKTLGPSPQ